MELLPDTHILTLWLIKYGSFVLFVMLTLGIIALPIPEETLMVIAGILMHKGKLNIPATIIFAYLGSVCGITMSYLLGRSAGQFLLTKYGRWFGINAAHIQRAHYWFERFGKWLLFIGYFIPGVRHFTGFSAGMTKLEYKYFALFAYLGALVWVSLFLSLGYFLGHCWFSIYEKLETLDWISIGLILLFAGIFFYFFKQRTKKY